MPSPTQASKIIRFRQGLSRQDLLAVDHIIRTAGVRCGFKSNSAAARWCVAQQKLLDDVYGVPGGDGPNDPNAAEEKRKSIIKCPGEKYYLLTAGRVRKTVGVELRGRQAGREPLAQWSFMVYETTKRDAQAIADSWELTVLSDAIRMAIRIQASLWGFRPENGVW